MGEGEEKPSGKNWSRVAELYARVADERDSLGPNGRANREILATVDSKLPFNKATFVLDMGTGPGQLISGVLNSPQASQIPGSARIVAADISSAFVAQCTTRKQKEINSGNKVWERLEVHQWDGLDLSSEVEANSVSHLLSSYTYHAMKNERECLQEAYRILAPGGLFAAAIMGDTDWGHLPSFVSQVRPDKRPPHLQGRHWYSVEGVTSMLSEGGFKDVEARTFDMGVLFDTRKDAVDFVLEGFPFMKGLMAELGEDEQRRVVELMYEFLEKEYPEEPCRLKGTALVGWGTK